VSAARIDRVVVPGVFSLDGRDFDVENNVWLVGDDDDEVPVIDAPHDACLHAGHGDATTIAAEMPNVR
jgi:hypothetical protein